MDKLVIIKPVQDAFTMALKAQTGLCAVKELKFHDTRKWRFDYCVTHNTEGKSVKVAIEVDGGAFSKRQYRNKQGQLITTIGGRHNSGVGKLLDDEKFNHAAMLGYRVLKVTPDTLFNLSTFEMIVQACL